MKNKNSKHNDWFKSRPAQLWLASDETGRSEASFIRTALNLQKGEYILDAPCGRGRISYHLAKDGCQVYGLDIRESFIKDAKSRFRSEGIKANFKVMDLRAMKLKQKFAAILCWGGSFGYFSDDENINLIKDFASLLKHNGRLLVEQPSREYIRRCLKKSKKIFKRGGIVRTQWWDHDTQRMISKLSSPKYEDISSIRLYTPLQISHLFRQAGLVVDRIYGDISLPIEKSLYKKSSSSMIIVGHKL